MKTETYLTIIDSNNKAVRETINEVYINQANEKYGSDEIEFDDMCLVSPSEEGAFVQAWVWVYKEELDEEHFQTAIDTACQHYEEVE